MRLKQLLGVLLLPCIFVITAAAAFTAPQLTEVGVAPKAGATVVSLRTSGAFTHTEYRPNDNLLLVDLSGVSAARMDGKTHLVSAPGVVSYRVLSYKSSDGADVARVELTLAAGSDVKLTEGASELDVRVASKSGNVDAPAAAVATNMPVAPTRESAVAQTASAVSVAHAIQVEKLGVVRLKDGVAVEIVANGPISAKALKLSGPDRLVLDIPNAISAARMKTVDVNTNDIKDVRMARYQENPPVTRVVVDLAQDRDYQLEPSGNRLRVKFSPIMAIPASTAPAIVATSAETSITKPVLDAQQPSTSGTVAKAEAPAAKPADFVVVHPQVHTVTAGDKAASAAAHYGDKSDNAFDMNNEQSASLKPVNQLLAFQQTGTPGAPIPAPPAARPKYTGEPISVNLKDVDLKDFFRLIHEISGLNVVLDPNVHGTLTLVLDDVPWDQALDIVLKNNGLDRQLEGNVLRIATVETLKREADNRRAQIEAQALAVDKVTVTRFLSYAHSKDVVPTVKRFLSSRGDVVSDDRSNALIIDDIPNVIPKIDDLLAKLDRKSPQVEIEARVVAATRNFAREIGTQFGFGWGNNPTAVGGAPAAGNSPLQPGYIEPPPYFTSPGVKAQQLKPGTVPTTTPASIPLFSNLPAVNTTSGFSIANLGSAYRLDALLTMSESRGLLKILSRPRVVTQNNIAAVVRQGVRVPVVTQAQLGGPPTVTYVDAFLRLSVTPQITAENTVFLNIDVENTTPDFTQEVNGNPTLVTSQATTQILANDGGTVVMGGVMLTKNQVEFDQVPLLGNIPLLGNLFKHRLVTTNTQELIFFITPRIVQN